MGPWVYVIHIRMEAGGSTAAGSRIESFQRVAGIEPGKMFAEVNVTARFETCRVRQGGSVEVRFSRKLVGLVSNWSSAGAAEVSAHARVAIKQIGLLPRPLPASVSNPKKGCDW